MFLITGKEDLKKIFRKILLSDLLAKQHFYTDLRVLAFLERKIDFAVGIVSLKVWPKLEGDSDIFIGERMQPIDKYYKLKYN